MAIISDGSSGYGRAIVRGVTRYANMQRRWLILADLRNTQVDPGEQLPRVDGAIVAGVSSEVLAAARRRTPNVVLCSGSGDAREGCVASLDDYAVGVMAAEHLLDCRLERFAFFGRVNSLLTIKRHRGFVDTIRARGGELLEMNLGWDVSPSHQAEARAELDAIVEWVKVAPKPLGVMAWDDTGANVFANACLTAGVSVPDRVAIVGVNNDDLLCECTWPPLSSVDGDYSRVGYAAASMLDRLLKGETLSEQEREVRLLPQHVVRRQSTDVLAIVDPDVAEAVRFIREHACDPCNVEEVLRHVPVGRRWLERQFMKYLNRSPHDEILRVRIDVAKRLLVQRELKLDDISQRCGFSITQQFHRAFVRATGMPPGAYRKSAAS